MFIRIVFVFLSLLGLGACAEPATVGGMVAPQASANVPAGSPLAETLCLTSVEGGEETNPIWTSEVDNASFRTALQQSLVSSGLAAPDPAACSYDVTAHLLGLAQPVAGFSMEVTANVNYGVFDRATQEPYYQTTVTTPFTATPGDAFLGVTRLRLANEGAVRTNIQRFMGQLIDHARTTPPEASAEPPSS